MKIINLAPGLLLLFLSATNIQANPLHIHVLDVGEGQSVLLRKNDHAILIDTGHAGQVYRVLERMQQYQIKRLDYLFLTHLHPDHASGYFSIHHHYPQLQVIDNCQAVGSVSHSDMVRWVGEALANITNRRCVEAGDSINWMDIQLQILWPAPPVTPDAGLNHQSLVISLTLNGKTLLVMGDADKAAENELLDKNVLAPVEVLVVGHHGAADSSSERFLNAVNPEYAVISTNAENIRGYPSPDVLNLLHRYSKQVHKSWEDGDFYLTFE